jgi:hypothetical protein
MGGMSGTKEVLMGLVIAALAFICALGFTRKMFIARKLWGVCAGCAPHGTAPVLNDLNLYYLYHNFFSLH